MVSPPPWPERPGFAQDFDLFWLCAFHLPPEPWPDNPSTPEEYAALYGPPGTVWTYSANALINRLTVLGAGQGATALVNRYLSRIKELKLPPFYTLSWTNPGPDAAFVEEFSMRWVHATIHGKLGSTEEVAHTFNLRTQPAPDIDQSVANMVTLAGQLRDRWQLFLDSQIPGGTNTVRSQLSADLVYDEVRCAYLEQTTAGVNPKGVRDPAKRPNYLVKTQYATFGVNAKGTLPVSTALPWEVALCLTLNSNERGRSYRGRTYLGGLTQSQMGNSGMFNAAQVQGIAANFGSIFVAGVNANTGCQFQVVSRTHLVASPVQGVRVGLVPDSQRRRRRNQPEGYVQSWGQAVGAATP